ncbi:MAG TPA: hypothetical protein VL327_11390 [Pyrinomonadaceae bacterium]|jgi:hypothetical protein|nr:hypothetical protein [Pyrinomonadaceae bacterium]
MAVLVEAISVIIKKSAIEREFSQDWNKFVEFVPNETLCADDEIARVGFMVPEDVKSFIEQLENKGIKFLENGEAVEIAVVDQLNGITTNCDWLEYGNILLDEKYKVAACRFVGSEVMTLLTPDGWKYENSLSHNGGYVLPERLRKGFKFLRHQDGLDVYLNTVTGKEVFIGRTEEPFNSK